MHPTGDVLVASFGRGPSTATAESGAPGLSSISVCFFVRLADAAVEAQVFTYRGTGGAAFDIGMLYVRTIGPTVYRSVAC